MSEGKRRNNFGVRISLPSPPPREHIRLLTSLSDCRSSTTFCFFFDSAHLPSTHHTRNGPLNLFPLLSSHEQPLQAAKFVL